MPRIGRTNLLQSDFYRPLSQFVHLMLRRREIRTTEWCYRFGTNSFLLRENFVFELSKIRSRGFEISFLRLPNFVFATGKIVFSVGKILFCSFNKSFGSLLKFVCRLSEFDFEVSEVRFHGSIRFLTLSFVFEIFERQEFA